MTLTGTTYGEQTDMDNLVVETKETVVLLGAQEDKTLPLSDATTVVLLKRCGMRRRGTWSSTRRVSLIVSLFYRV